MVPMAHIIRFLLQGAWHFFMLLLLTHSRCEDLPDFFKVEETPEKDPLNVSKAIRQTSDEFQIFFTSSRSNADKPDVKMLQILQKLHSLLVERRQWYMREKRNLMQSLIDKVTPFNEGPECLYKRLKKLVSTLIYGLRKDENPSFHELKRIRVMLMNHFLRHVPWSGEMTKNLNGYAALVTGPDYLMQSLRKDEQVFDGVIEDELKITEKVCGLGLVRSKFVSLMEDFMKSMTLNNDTAPGEEELFQNITFDDDPST